jgi:hypothetical protein
VESSLYHLTDVSNKAWVPSKQPPSLMGSILYNYPFRLLLSDLLAGLSPEFIARRREQIILRLIHCLLDPQEPL